MRMSSLRVVFSLSALFLLPNAAHARPIELSDFRRVLVNFQRLADDQFATIDEKSEHKNRGWGLGLIFRPADLLISMPWPPVTVRVDTRQPAERPPTRLGSSLIRKWSRVESPLGSVCSI